MTLSSILFLIAMIALPVVLAAALIRSQRLPADPDQAFWREVERIRREDPNEADLLTERYFERKASADATSRLALKASAQSDPHAALQLQSSLREELRAINRAQEVFGRRARKDPAAQRALEAITVKEQEVRAELTAAQELRRRLLDTEGRMPPGPA